MSAAKFTKGPWRVSGKQSIRGPNGEHIAKTNWDNGAANAHLTAAAPDLYEALEALTDRMPPQDHYLCHYGITTKEKCGRCSRQIAARAALAKARGEL